MTERSRQLSCASSGKRSGPGPRACRHHGRRRLTLSQTKDNGAGSLENPNGNFPAPQDFYNMDADFGLSAYHQPYNSTTTLVWDLPVGRGRTLLGSAPLAVDALLGGWQFAGVNTITAGEPVTLTYIPGPTFQVSGIQQDFRGANNYRPDVTRAVLVPDGSRSVQNYLNRDTVVIPTDPSRPFGNAPRNNVRGPRFWSFDVQATKRVPMPWATAPITASHDPRIVQLAAKVSF